MECLYSVIECAKYGDNESLEFLITKFEPIINGLAWKLNSDCGRADLIIFFIKLVRGIKLDNIQNLSDGALVNYIKKSLYREYFKLKKERRFIEVELMDKFSTNTSEYIDSEYIDSEYKIFLDQLESRQVISKNENKILIKKYCYLSTEQEIARELNVSRQAINKKHKSAIKKIREYLN